MKRIPLSELIFQVYRLTFTALTMTVCIRLLWEYSWERSTLYGLATICSYFLGQFIVAALQNRAQNAREQVHQENEW